MPKLPYNLFAAFFILLGALTTLLALGSFLGLPASRAPDVLYGDEMSFPEGIVLLLVVLALCRGNRRINIFAALMAVINGIAAMFDVWTLQKPFANCWVGIWVSVFAVASWLSVKSHRVTPTEAAKTA